MIPKARLHLFSALAAVDSLRRHRVRGRERGRKRGLVKQRLDGTCGVGAGDHDRMGSRAALARPGAGHRRDLVQRPPQHHGSAGEARRRPRAGPQPRRELGYLEGRQDGDLPPSGRRQVDERRPGDRRGLRMVVEADGLAGARRRLRVPVLWDRRRRRLQRLREELRRAPRRGRRQGSGRPDPRGEADLRTAVVRAAGEPSLVPGRSPGHRRGVRRQLDRSEEHRHGRPVQARVLGARLVDRPGEERRRGAEPKTSRSRA